MAKLEHENLELANENNNIETVLVAKKSNNNFGEKKSTKDKITIATKTIQNSVRRLKQLETRHEFLLAPKKRKELETKAIKMRRGSADDAESPKKNRKGVKLLDDSLIEHPRLEQVVDYLKTVYHSLSGI